MQIPASDSITILAGWIRGYGIDPPSWLVAGNAPEFIKWGFNIYFVACLIFIFWPHSGKQIIIDKLSNLHSWAIHNLVNPKAPFVDLQGNLIFDEWKKGFEKWCSDVEKDLQHGIFSTKDRNDFKDMGYIQTVTMTGNPQVDKIHSLLKLRMERLKEILNRVGNNVPR